MGLLSRPLSNDEYATIYTSHFPVAFRKGGDATNTDYSLMFGFGAIAFTTCALTMLAWFVPWWLGMVFLAIVFLIIFFRVLTLIVYAASIICGKYFKSFYWPSIVWYGWWPFWLFAVSVFGAGLGYLAGSYLQSNYLGPYFEYKKLQMYRGINPNVIPGSRVQDSGLVDFTANVQIDRAKGGCFMDRGNTYCVAPIVEGGEIKDGVGGIPRTGSYDFFAVGKNCCSCPNHNFQCGDWKNPFARGGLRSLDVIGRPFYRLALDDWEATYEKSSKQPMFYEWVEQPEYVWKMMWNHTMHVGILAVALALAIGLTIGLMVDKIRQILYSWEFVVPRCSFAPPPGPFMSLLTAFLLPRMYSDFNTQCWDIANMPVGWLEYRPLMDTNAKDFERKRNLQYSNQTNMARTELEEDVLSSIFAPPGFDRNPDFVPYSSTIMM